MYYRYFFILGVLVSLDFPQKAFFFNAMKKEYKLIKNIKREEGGSDTLGLNYSILR